MASFLTALQNASSLKELAPLLDIPASALSYTLYKIPLQQRYTFFSIPKKGGGTRDITAPIDRLKALQRSLANLLTDCRAEIEEKTPRKIVSHGFRSGASISTNAYQHRKRRYLLNLDLEDFFPTLNFGRVRGYFIKNNDFLLHPSVATVIAQIACDGTALPQGSPCSPIISDLLGHLLDVRLSQLAKKYKCTYSRYADDLSFSTNQKSFPSPIAYQLAASSSVWVLGDDLLEQINRAGFSVNHRKTRMQYRGSRQVVTGLTVNEKVNIRSDYYRSARLACDALFRSGEFHLHGNSPNEKGTLNQLGGILSHIYYIKRLEKVRTSLETPKKYEATAPKNHEGIERLYYRFLFFQKFVIPEKPLVICEGKTDSVYLNAAIKNLNAYAGALFNVVNGQKHIAVQFFKYTDTTRDVLGLGGGTGHFPAFMSRYGDALKRYKHAPLNHPVILLVDNDSGSNNVFNAAKHTSVSHTRAVSVKAELAGIP